MPFEPTRFRDESGLTEKQREAIPHLATAESMLQGIKLCVSLGIVSSKEYFYHEWWKDPVFVKAVADARAALYGEARDDTLQRFRSFYRDAANVVIGGMLTKGPQQVQWTRLYYDMLSVLSGQPMIPVPKTSINIGLVSHTDGMLSARGFPSLVDDHSRKRHELLRALRAHRTEAIIEPVAEGEVVQGNGNEGGNGHG